MSYVSAAGTCDRLASVTVVRHSVAAAARASLVFIGLHVLRTALRESCGSKGAVGGSN